MVHGVLRNVLLGGTDLVLANLILLNLKQYYPLGTANAFYGAQIVLDATHAPAAPLRCIFCKESNNSMERRNMYNKQLLPAAVATTLLAGAAFAPVASAEFEIAATSPWSAITASAASPSPTRTGAIQGGFDAAWDAGFYVGVWGSTVDFDTNGPGFDGSLELDYYFGWGSTIGSSGDLSIDVGYIYYDYPGDDAVTRVTTRNFTVSGSWRDLAIVGANYSDDYYAETDEFWYVYGDYSLGLFGGLRPDSRPARWLQRCMEEDGGFLVI